MKKSVWLLSSWLLVLLYFIYIFVNLSKVADPSDSTQQLFTGLVLILMFPHILVVFIGFIFNVLGWAMNKRGFALTGAILYSVGMLLFFPLFYYLLIQTVLSYIGYAKIKKEIPVVAITQV